ncbi:hypothetical protein [Acerihabitans arboris]|uniref:Uncharacterized protein n=1 Tax=Acerihabitans arboris TaxID=2691583 RepID=A0A845SRH7_9GAMM|nr:hypothetical protein [Acerihabitans arboris]NDL65238.1 hypothetical protein [Acerihabitans arboris]
MPISAGTIKTADWDYRQPGKIYARLTLNPYRAWQNAAMADFLRKAQSVD